LQVQVGAPVATNRQQVELRLRRVAPARGRHPIGQLDGGGAEAAAQHEIHHPLVGAIAVFQRDLLGQDVDPRDRLGRQVADLLESGDAAAVDQHHRRAARAPAAAGLRRELGQQVGDRADAIGADVRRPQLHLGRDVADDRAGQVALPADDDVGLLGRVLRLRGCLLVLRCRGRRGGRRRGRLLRRRWHAHKRHQSDSEPTHT
jgi:hypothetical protein